MAEDGSNTTMQTDDMPGAPPSTSPKRRPPLKERQHTVPLAPTVQTLMKLEDDADGTNLEVRWEVGGGGKNGVADRQYSETPSWIELKKWRRLQEDSEMAHMSLHQLAREGDTRRIRNCLDHTESLSAMFARANEKDEDGLTPLHYAARYNHFGVVKLLVERGAEVGAPGEDGITPLHFAARCKRSRSAKNSVAAVSLASAELARSKRTRSLTFMDQKLPIHTLFVLNETDATLTQRSVGSSGGDYARTAARHLETESIVTFLVQHDADPNAQDVYGMTPLHFAAMRGNVIVANELAKCDAVAVDILDNQQMTPLHAACAHGWMEVAELLLREGADSRALDHQQCTPLHLAAQDGHLNLVQLLVDFAAQASAADGSDDAVRSMLADSDYERNTPLILAVENGHFEVAALLVSLGADVNAHRLLMQSPLHAAGVVGDVRIVELLVANGAAVDSRNAQQHTPLHRAAAYNHWQVVEYLLDKDADIEARDRDGFTPLLVAAGEGHSETCVTLLKLGANLAAVDKLDRTAIYLSAQFNNFSTIQVLLKQELAQPLVDRADRYNNTPLHIAAQNGFVDVLLALLDGGARIDAKNEEEKTPLHLAAQNGRTRVVRELVRRSKRTVADDDEDASTPLHVAATAGHEMVVRELLDAGADIAARNAVLWTPLDCAAAAGWERTCLALLDYDAPVDPVDKAKTTPLHLACQKGHVGVVNMLLQRGADIGLLDHLGRNCLDHAIDHNHRDVALAIIADPNWRDALRNTHGGDAAERRNSPLRKLIRKMADVADAVFDRCTRTQGHSERKDYRVDFDYEFLDDTYVDWAKHNVGSATRIAKLGGFNESGKLIDAAVPYTTDSNLLKLNHPLNVMVHRGRGQLLNHPLVISLLRHKWNSYGRYVYYLALLLYLCFVALLTAFVVRTPPPFGFNSTECASTLSQDVVPFYAKYGIVLLTLVHLVKELYQLYQRGWRYLTYVENYIEWIVYIFAFLLVVNFSECSARTGIREPWQWQLGAACVFLAWMNLVLMIRKFPKFGIYVVMFTDILTTFSRFFIVFFLFLVAFALTFFALLQNQFPFRDFPSSLLKTTVMMIGEFEFDSIFNVQNASRAETVFYGGMSYALFSTFVILMTIITMNLLIGLAVDDIKGVQDKAQLTKLAMQVELVLHVEQALPDRLRRRWAVSRQTLYPNKHRRANNWRHLFWTGPTQLSVATIADELNREKDELTQLGEAHKSLAVGVDSLQRRVDEVQRQQQRLHSMMHAVLAHFQIAWEDQDEFR